MSRVRHHLTWSRHDRTDYLMRRNWTSYLFITIILDLDLETMDLSCRARDKYKYRGFCVMWRDELKKDLLKAYAIVYIRLMDRLGQSSVHFKLSGEPWMTLNLNKPVYESLISFLSRKTAFNRFNYERLLTELFRIHLGVRDISNFTVKCHLETPQTFSR